MKLVHFIKENGYDNLFKTSLLSADVNQADEDEQPEDVKGDNDAVTQEQCERPLSCDRSFDEFQE